MRQEDIDEVMANSLKRWQLGHLVFDGGNIESAKRFIRSLQAENAKLKAQLTWRPASELPEEDQIVIATYLNSYGKRRRVRAVYIRQYEEEAGEDDELCVEYCEEQDEWYLKEGWYELIDNWDYSLAAIVEGVVDYWMPMPPAPDTLPDGWEE